MHTERTLLLPKGEERCLRTRDRDTASRSWAGRGEGRGEPCGEKRATVRQCKTSELKVQPWRPRERPEGDSGTLMF